MIMSGGYTLHFRYFIKTYMVIKTTEEREREKKYRWDDMQNFSCHGPAFKFHVPLDWITASCNFNVMSQTAISKYNIYAVISKIKYLRGLGDWLLYLLPSKTDKPQKHALVNYEDIKITDCPGLRKVPGLKGATGDLGLD